MKVNEMIMYIVGIVLSLIIIAQLLPQGLGPILNIANIPIDVNGTSTPFGDIPGAQGLIPLIILIGTISVIGIIIKIVKDSVGD